MVLNRKRPVVCSKPLLIAARLATRTVGLDTLLTLRPLCWRTVRANRCVGAVILQQWRLDVARITLVIAITIQCCIIVYLVRRTEQYIFQISLDLLS